MSGGELSGDQLVDCPEESGQRFAAPCRCRDEKVLTAGYLLPALLLNVRRLADPFHEPAGDKRVELRESAQLVTPYRCLPLFYPD